MYQFISSSNHHGIVLKVKNLEVNVLVYDVTTLTHIKEYFLNNTIKNLMNDNLILFISKSNQNIRIQVLTDILFLYF